MFDTYTVGSAFWEDLQENRGFDRTKSVFARKAGSWAGGMAGGTLGTAIGSIVGGELHIY